MKITYRLRSNFFLCVWYSLISSAHCNVASLQESFAMTFDETYISAIHQSEDEIKEYQTQRKKLESRRYVIFNHDENK